MSLSTAGSTPMLTEADARIQLLTLGCDELQVKICINSAKVAAALTAVSFHVLLEHAVDYVRTEGVDTVLTQQSRRIYIIEDADTSTMN